LGASFTAPSKAFVAPSTSPLPESEGLLREDHGVVELLRLDEDRGEVLGRLLEVGLDLERRPVALLGGAAVARLVHDEAEVVMRVGLLRVLLDRRLEVRARRGPVARLQGRGALGHVLAR
jgi:hypothetical protein